MNEHEKNRIDTNIRDTEAYQREKEYIRVNGRNRKSTTTTKGGGLLNVAP
ncbi:MAG: hypothetical protein GY797_02995 [Deltaproteobacteria bacterium]|nr:hypothetical protein [Deltaproteobacteria bacterium]